MDEELRELLEYDNEIYSESDSVKLGVAGSYKFFDYSFELENIEVNYARFVSYFNKKSEVWAHEFRKEYDSSFRDVDSALKGVGNLVAEHLKKGVERCVEYLTYKGVYTYDESSFFEKAIEYPFFESWEEQFKTIASEYDQIDYDADFEKYNREMRKETRARMLGGGFGLNGFVKGAITASVFNTATGIFHSGVNALGNYVTESKRLSKKEKLFQNMSNQLENEMAVLFANLGYVLMIILYEERVMVFRSPSNEDLSQFNPLFNNLKSKRIPEEAWPETFVKLLELNPYDVGIYKWFLEVYGDNGDITNMAKKLCIDIDSIKEDIINERLAIILDDKDKYDWNKLSYPDALNSVNDLVSMINSDKEKLNLVRECEAEIAVKKVKESIEEEIKRKEKEYEEKVEKGIVSESPIDIDEESIKKILEDNPDRNITYSLSQEYYDTIVNYVSKNLDMDFKGEHVLFYVNGHWDDDDGVNNLIFVAVFTNQNLYTWGYVDGNDKKVRIYPNTTLKKMEYKFETGIFSNRSDLVVHRFGERTRYTSLGMGQDGYSTIQIVNQIIPYLNPVMKLENIISESDLNSSKECERVLKLLNECDVDESLKSEYKKRIQNKIDKCVKEEEERNEKATRTYNGKVYDTVELMRAAETDDEALATIISGVEKLSLEEIIEICKRIKGYEYKDKDIWELYCSNISDEIKNKLDRIVERVDEFTSDKCVDVISRINGLEIDESVSSSYLEIVQSRLKNALLEDEWREKIVNLSELSYSQMEDLIREIRSGIVDDKIRGPIESKIIEEYYSRLNVQLEECKTVFIDFCNSVKGEYSDLHILDWDGKYPQVGSSCLFKIIEYDSKDGFVYTISRDEIIFCCRSEEKKLMLKDIVSFEFKKSFLSASLDVILTSGNTVAIPFHKDRIEFHAKGLTTVVNSIKKHLLYETVSKELAVNNEEVTQPKGISFDNNTKGLTGQSMEYTSLEDAIIQIFAPYFNGEPMAKITNKIIKGMSIPSEEKVLYAHDASITENGKLGFAMTDKAIYSKMAFDKKLYVTRYDQIKDAKNIAYTGSARTILAYDGIPLIYSAIQKKDLLVESVMKLRDYLNNADGANVVNTTKDSQILGDVVEQDNSSKTDTECVFCSQCGNKMPGGSKFCAKCGSAIIYLR